MVNQLYITVLLLMRKKVGKRFLFYFRGYGKSVKRYQAVKIYK